MKKLIRLVTVVILSLAFAGTLTAQVTTAGISGRIVDDQGALVGVTVKAVHEPSGSNYHTVTNADGRFALQGMRTGGPYTVEMLYMGFEKIVYKDVYLQLGESYLLNTTMKAADEMLEEVVVSGSTEALFNSQKTGAATNFSRQRIEMTPSISRSIYDVTRMTPQATSAGSGMSFAGSNNRYNSFQIDGTVNNDVFGLSSSGTNGGQSGANPISLEAIEEVQVVIAPFDVRQSGFTGGGINAITKSGTNTFHGSVYGYFNNEKLAGKTANEPDKNKRERLSKQSDKTFGVTFGGPIIKNKLFFFGNFEKTDKSYPVSYGVDNGSNITKAEADQVINHLKTLTGGYDGGGYGAMDVETKSTKVLGRIDWNISDSHKFTVRYSYLEGKDLNFSNSKNALRLNNNGYWMNNKTHSVVAELNSRFSDEWSNEFRFGYTGVRDFREIEGDPIPYVKINLSNSRSIELGSERYSPANRLDQDIFTLTNNVTWFKGNHTFTFGTHNEFYKMENLFIRENYGSYVYSSLNDFLTVGTAGEVAPNEYNYSFSREDITGTKSWAPSFGAAQLGFYAQDEWNVTNLFRLTYGLRVDLPIFFDEPIANTAFNSSSIAQEYGVATNQMPKSKLLWSPRVGFRWNLNEDRKTLIRGGLGIFTGRVPFVWISNNFSSTGVEVSRTRLTGSSMTNAFNNDGFRFQIDPNRQYTPSNVMTSEVDVVDKNFKFPQVFRVNLAVEQVLPFGIKGTLEGLYSKTLNNIMYKNLGVEESGKYLDNGADKRPIYQNVINPATGASYTNEYTGIVYLTNTSKGYTYSITGKLEKSFNFGLNTMFAYTIGESKGLNDGTSSQAYSNWSYNENYAGPNNPELAYTDFDVRHRLIGSISYRKEYAKHFATSVSLFYNGQSGSRYTLCYQYNINGDGVNGNDVMYIPTDAELATMKFTPYTSGSVTVTEADQRAAFGEWINSEKQLRDNKGQYSKRNGMTTPFEHRFDLRIAQDFYLNIGGQRHTLQVNFDILNIGNLFKNDWGIDYTSSYSYTPIRISSVDASGVPTFRFEKPAGEHLYSVSDYYSRWRAQFGIKYFF